MNKVGIYLRVSSEEQARVVEGSLVSQRKRLEEYVEGQSRREANWGKVIDVYCDEAKSGKDMNRPEFQRLLGDIRSGRINLVLATELSRLSRSIKDFCGLWDLFKEHHTKMITLREQFDTTTAAGEMMVFNLMNFAQYERKQTAERISAHWASRAKRGLWNGGTIPLGYDRHPTNKGTLVPNPIEAEQVRAIFKTFLDVGSLRQTCFKLTELGIYSKSYVNKAGAAKGGGHFTVSALYTLLKNRALIGIREVNKRSDQRSEVPAVWPAIVDQSTFEKVQAILKANKSRFKPNDWKTYPYPLTDKVVCGECGKPLSGKSAHGYRQTHYYYAHSRMLKTDGVNHTKRCRLERMRAKRIEELVLKSIKTVLDDSTKFNEMIAAYRNDTTSGVPGLEGRLKTIEADIRATERRVENLVTRLSDLPQDVSAEPVYKQLRELNAKVAKLKSARTELDAQVNQAKGKDLDEEGLRVRLAQAVRMLESAPPDKQRPIYTNVIKFAEMHPTRVRIGLWSPLKNQAGGDAAKEGGPLALDGNAAVARSTAVLNGG